ncbi:FlgD immunoglobulin-like domain containing protein [Sulfurimonas sp.]
MAITSTGLNAATNQDVAASTAVENKTALGKDDFMTLLLVELQHQDPTEPMDSEKILTQTSQLASLESAENTNKALEELSASLQSNQEFSTIAAIGKTADLGSDAIALDEGSTSTFEMYFPDAIEQGTISITDLDGNNVATIDVGTNPAGVYQFDWDGNDLNGNPAESGIYHVNANYSNPDGDVLQTRLGAYPIESVRFEGGDTLVKVGSNYVPLSQIVEVY